VAAFKEFTRRNQLTKFYHEEERQDLITGTKLQSGGGILGLHSNGLGGNPVGKKRLVAQDE